MVLKRFLLHFNPRKQQNCILSRKILLQVIDRTNILIGSVNFFCFYLLMKETQPYNVRLFNTFLHKETQTFNWGKQLDSTV